MMGSGQIPVLWNLFLSSQLYFSEKPSQAQKKDYFIAARDECIQFYNNEFNHNLINYAPVKF